MGTPGGQPAGPSPFLAGIGKGRFLGARAALLQRFDGSGWLDVARYRSAHKAGIAVDEAIGEGAEAGALRVVDAPLSASSRLLMIAGAAVFVILVLLIVWLFVAGK